MASGSLVRSFDDPEPRSFKWFGSDVDIDGPELLIGSPGEHDDPLNLGHAYVFDAASGALLRTFTDPTPTASSYDDFGYALDMDGDFVAIGEPGDGSGVGSVHVFQRSTGALLQTFTDPTPTGIGNFGRALALDNGRLVVGEIDNLYDWDSQVGRAYMFDAVSGALLTTFEDPTPTEDDWFGDAVSIDGDCVLIGARFDDTYAQNGGQAHLFDANSGALLRTLNDPASGAQDGFGNSVLLDGNRIIVGAYADTSNDGLRTGQVHLFLVPEPSAAWLVLIAAQHRGEKLEFALRRRLEFA